jgi:ABC-type transport system substrate-binding protein
MDRNGRLRLSLRNQGIHFVEGPPLEVGYLVFNFRNMLLAKLPIRQAITLAIDRKKVNRLLFGDRGLIANSPIPPAFVEAAAVDDRPFLYSVPDLTGAKRILAEAGYPEGKGLPEFILDAPGAFAGTRDKGAAESMVQDLAQVGIKVQIRTDSMTKFYERCKTGDLQIAWVSWYADYADVENFLIMFRSDPEDPLKKYNYGFYQNEEFDRLYDQILVKYPGPDRTGLVVKAVEILRKDLPWVFLCHIKRGFLMHKAVQGFRYNVLNQSLRDARLEGGRRG